MAKDKFYRSKPHVNAGTLFGLRNLGFSALGVSEIARGQGPTDSRDRKLVAEVVGTAARLSTGKRQNVVNDSRPEIPLVASWLHKLGLTFTGSQQIPAFHCVTDPEDRGLLCEVLQNVANKNGEEYVYYKITLTTGR